MVSSHLNLDTLALRLVMETYDIHTGTLFMPAGWPTLQVLCGKLGAPHEAAIYADWKEFADCLGDTDEKVPRVSADQQGNIENHYKSKGPVWMVLLTFAQWDDARLSAVINAIRLIKRMDVIGLIKDHVRTLVEHVRNHAIQDLKSKIFKPPNVGWVPLELKPPCSDPSKHFRTDNITLHIPRPQLDDEQAIVNSKQYTPCALKVMLTFADDGEEAAYRIATILRSHKPKIGVVILNEQLQHVIEKSEDFIRDCFDQVDIIMPILTQGYFDTISSHPVSTEEPESIFHTDQRYAKYIYNAFTKEFIHNKCRNPRVRCIIPKDRQRLSSVTQRNSRMYGELQVYCPEIDIQQFIKLILKKAL